MRIQSIASRDGLRLLWCLALVLTFSLLSCDDDSSPSGPDVVNTDFSASEDFFLRIGIADQSRLRLEAISGSVEITGASGVDSVTIWGERRVESESVADAEEHLQQLSVEMSESGGQIAVWTEQPEQSHGRNYIVEYHAEVPTTWQLAVEQVNGNIAISTTENSVEANLVNGTMRLWDISGSVDGEGINGTIDGKIFLPPSETCTLRITNGTIGLLIPQSTSATFAAQVSVGTIALHNLSLQNQNVTPTSLTGTLGAGEGEIELLTVNGNISVTGF